MSVLVTPLQGTISISGVEESAAVTGRGFLSLATIVASAIKNDAVTGRGFSAPAQIYGGATVLSEGFGASLSISYQTEDTIYVTGSGFAAPGTLTLAGDFPAHIEGRGFTAAVQLLGGAVISGRNFTVAPTIAAITSEYVAVTGRGFYSKATISATAPTSVSVTGRGFSAGLYYSRITGRGFTQDVSIVTEFTAAYAEAVIMNLRTTAISRYQNYPFQHIAKIGDSYYGVQADGLYQLTGEYDALEETLVNGTIHGKAHDFGVFNSKNVPYLYVNGDDEYTVTGYVDSAEQPAFVSGFSGRRVKLARGNKGRYWSFKIEGIKKLQGIELMPDALSRRVK